MYICLFILFQFSETFPPFFLAEINHPRRITRLNARGKGGWFPTIGPRGLVPSIVKSGSIPLRRIFAEREYVTSPLHAQPFEQRFEKTGKGTNVQ